MMERLQSLFDRQQVLPEHHDIQMAAAALMIEVMRADRDVADEEISRVSRLLGEQFDLGERDIGELIELASGKLKKSVSLHKFTSSIRESWGNQQRVELLQQLWSIAYADGKVDAHERHAIRKIGALLYMTERQMYAAKERARKEMAT